MASVGEDTIEMATLGRPFQLGMLYDCRKDALIPGITLWDHEVLQGKKASRPQINTKFNIATSDSIDDKASALGIDGSLKLSLLGGLVNVSGAAKYFQDTKKSHKQARVTLQYHTTTMYEHLTMSHLGEGKVSHRNAFGDGTATHVVTAVLYGASAYFVFDREVSSEESKTDVEGEIQLTCDKLKNIKVGAEVSMSNNDSEKTAGEKFNCTFHGDFHLTTNPSSFSDAVKVYTDLPKMLEGEKGLDAVPVKVWLYPLVKLDSRAARLQTDISNHLITMSESVIESLNMTEMRCNDLLKDTTAKTFPTIQGTIQNYQQMCHQYKVYFMKKLGLLLPSIRGGGIKESDLAELLKSHEESPFNKITLNQWLTIKEKETITVNGFLRQLKKIGVKLDDNLDDLLSDLRFDNVVCFMFTSLEQPDPFLSNLSNYLKSAASMKTLRETPEAQKKSLEWLTSDVRLKMRKHFKMFEDWKSSINSDTIRFIVASKPDENHPGACIFLYENGSDEDVCFVPPSKPVCPSTNTVSHDSVIVQLASSCSATVERRLEYRMKQQEEWMSQLVQQSQDTVTLPGLKSKSVYEIRSTAVGKLGYTVNSDVISVETHKADQQVTEVSLPQHWEDIAVEKQCQTFTLQSECPEHNEVLHLFQATCNNTVLKIERVQNPFLWKAYQIKKEEIEVRNRHQNNERRLFHGTSKEAVDRINHQGFNRSYAGRNAGYYGNGTSFAVTAAYASFATYSTPDEEGQKHMYLSRVLTGDFTQGRMRMIVPPAKGNTPYCYNSVVNDLSDPCTFVVFHDIQAYPEYLITFR